MQLPAQYVPRTLEKEIQAAIRMPEIVAVIGARQCGKTTLLHRIAHGLEAEKKSVVDFEDRDDLALFTDDIKGFAKLYVEGRDYLFIDEFQYAEDGGKNLKYLYDTYPAKIFITGSSATELSVQSIQHLVGRIFVFELYSFSFQEYLSCKESALTGFLTGELEPGSEIIRRINGHFRDYLIYGGYPRAVLASTAEEKELVLRNIFNTYLLRDIKQILNYRDDFKLTKLIHALALQVGRTCNYRELSTLTGFNHGDLLDALNILVKTFVIVESRPFFTNKRLELVKAPKLFFLDNGFRNATIKNFQPCESRTDTGILNENYLAAELAKRGGGLRFWRTKSKAEVDFVIEAQDQVVPVEVKSALTRPAVTRSFRSFLEKYRPARAFVTSDELLAEREIAGSHVRFVPHWYLPSQQDLR